MSYRHNNNNIIICNMCVQRIKEEYKHMTLKDENTSKKKKGQEILIENQIII